MRFSCWLLWAGGFALAVAVIVLQEAGIAIKVMDLDRPVESVPNGRCFRIPEPSQAGSVCSGIGPRTKYGGLDRSSFAIGLSPRIWISSSHGGVAA